MKACPFCAEQIQDDAIKCRFCGETLTQGGSPVLHKASDGLAQLMLAVPLIATMMIWFWVGSMNLLQGPDSSLMLIGLGTVLATAAMAYTDAKRLGMERSKNGPGSWAAFVALLWIIGFPAYLRQRKNFGARSYFTAGVLVALLFVLSWAAMAAAIAERQLEIRNIFQ